MTCKKTLPVYVWTGENDAKHATSGCEYFLKAEKRSCVLKRRIRIRVDSALMATPSEVTKIGLFQQFCVQEFSADTKPHELVLHWRELGRL